MSLDRSLKSKASLSRHRNVLSRAERLKLLAEQERWDENKPVHGLPKVAHRKTSVGGKVKKEAVPGAEGAAAAAPAAGAEAAPPAAKPGAKPGAKPAAKPAK